MLDRLPAMPLSELKRGDAIMLSSTTGSDPARVTAVMLLAGVEPLLTASPTATRDIMSGLEPGRAATSSVRRLSVCRLRTLAETLFAGPENKRPHEWGRGTQECVRHRNYAAWCLVALRGFTFAALGLLGRPLGRLGHRSLPHPLGGPASLSWSRIRPASVSLSMRLSGRSSTPVPAPAHAISYLLCYCATWANHKYIFRKLTAVNKMHTRQRAPQSLGPGAFQAGQTCHVGNPEAGRQPPMWAALST